MDGHQPRPLIRPACDLCHARKVKCDRAENCKNCRLTGAECRRTRSQRSLRPRVSRFDVIKERLEKLEKNTQKSSESDRLTSATGPAEPLPRMNETNQREKCTEASSIPSLVTTPNESSRRTAETRQLIQNELEQNDGMAKDRKIVLRSALEFVAGFSHASLALQPNWAGPDQEGDGVLGPTAPEMLYMMLPGIFDAYESDFRSLHWPDHITRSTLERMLLYLIENEIDDQISLHYRVCVYSKAFFFIMKSPQTHNSNAIRQRLKKSQREYKSIVLASLSRLPFLSPSSLSLVQALLSGAMLMQYLGNMSYSWSLTAFASRTLMSLNLHAVDTADELDDGIRASLYWCYYLDRVLSYLFVRQPSLPKLRIDPASMIPVNSPNPFQTTLKIMVEMAKVQEEILEMQLNQDFAADGSRVDRIITSADSLLSLISEARSSVPPEFRLDFDAAEFGHAAVLVNAFKCSRRSIDYHNRCLESARKALTVLIAMLDREDHQPDTADQYPSFLTWTVLLHPLTPYFVLFCNVVASSHKPDFDLMRKVTQSMSRFIQASEWVHKVHSLFDHFLCLCDPLMGQTASQDLAERDSNSFPDSIGHTGNPNSVEESLIWELFDFQPSLDWFDMPFLQEGSSN